MLLGKDDVIEHLKTFFSLSYLLLGGNNIVFDKSLLEKS